MQCEPTWIDISQALLTPLVGLIAIGVAIAQWRINKARYRHELFDRRYEMYESIRKVLGIVLRSNKVSPEEERDFLEATSGARFIFDDEIANYVREIFDQNSLIEVTQGDIEVLEVGAERTQKGEQLNNLRRWYREELTNLENRFAPYLSL